MNDGLERVIDSPESANESLASVRAQRLQKKKWPVGFGFRLLVGLTGGGAKGERGPIDKSTRQPMVMCISTGGAGQLADSNPHEASPVTILGWLRVIQPIRLAFLIRQGK